MYPQTFDLKLFWMRYGFRHEQDASGNFRTVDQEALARLERSFEIEDALASRTQQKWVYEALAGEMRPGSVKRLCIIARKARALAA